MARPRKETRESTARAMTPDEYTSMFWIDPSFLDTDQYHYRWVETHCLNEETQSVDRAVLTGYEAVELSALPSLEKYSKMMASIKGRGNGDPYVRKGNQILMRCPKKLYLNAKKAERSEAKRQSSHSKLHELAQSIQNAPTFVVNNEYKGSYTHERSAAVDRAFAPEEE